LLQGINNKDEEVRRKRIPLAQPMSALNPTTGFAVEQDGRLAGSHKVKDPLTPKERKAFRSQNKIKGIPIEGIKGFAEIKLQDNRRGFPFMAGLANVSSIDKVLGNTSPFDKASLISMNEKRNEGLKA